jgi:hypothetical protein
MKQFNTIGVDLAKNIGKFFTNFFGPNLAQERDFFGQQWGMRLVTQKNRCRVTF